MFIRFVIAGLDEDSGRRQGLFQAGDVLRESGRMTDVDIGRLDELECWFREKLATPDRFSLSSKPHRKAQAISWFRDSASEQIGRMREYQALLENYDIPVQVLREKRPGYVVYQDEHQVVAYPFSETCC